MKKLALPFLIGGLIAGGVFVYSQHFSGSISKDKIISSYRYIENDKEVIAYRYKTDEVASKLDNEIIEQRTNNIVVRDLGGNKRSAQSGYDFWKDGDVWKKVKNATTTPAEFEKIGWRGIIRDVFAAQTASTSPGTMADDDAVGDTSWDNPNNAKLSDNSYAACTVDGGICHYLKATNFGFSVPESTINGIIVEVEKVKVGFGNAYDEYAQIVKSNGSIGEENKADTITAWSTSESYFCYGNESDLWSESWIYSDINNSNFGFVLSVEDVGIVSARVDHIRITIYYTEGQPPADTCSCPSPSADWYVNSSDNCYLRTNCDIEDNGLYLLNTGAGSFHIIDGAELSLRKIESTSTPIKVENGCKINFK